MRRQVPQGRPARAVAAFHGPLPGAGLEVVPEDGGDLQRGRRREVGQRARVAHFIQHLERDVIRRERSQAAHLELLRHARGGRLGRVGDAGREGEIGLVDRSGGIAHVVGRGRARHAVVPRGGPLEHDRARAAEKHREIGDLRRRHVVLLERGAGVEAPSGDRDAGQGRDGIGAAHQAKLRLLMRDAGILRECQGGGAGHVRRRHRSAAQELVAARVRAARVADRRNRGEDAHPRGAETHRGSAVVGEKGLGIVQVRGGDREHVRHLIARWIERRRVVVGAVVPCRGDEQRAGLIRGRDGVHQRLAESAAAPGVVHHLRVHVGGVEHGADCGAGGARAARAQELDRHDARAPAHSRHAHAVVADGGDGARHVRAVTMVVLGIVVVVAEVVAVDVVHVTVAVVVDAVAGDLPRVGPYVGGEVGMGVIHAGVDHSHDDIGAGLHVPRFGRVHVRVGLAAGLPDVIEAPELGIARIVGRDRRAHLVVVFDGFHPRVPEQRAAHFLQVRALPEFDQAPGIDRRALQPARPAKFMDFAGSLAAGERLGRA